MLPIDSQAEKSKPSFISARSKLGYWLPRFTSRFSPARKELFWRHPVLPRQRENYIANLPFCPINRQTQTEVFLCLFAPSIFSYAVVTGFAPTKSKPFFGLH
jgi:hypothetical protein